MEPPYPTDNFMLAVFFICLGMMWGLPDSELVAGMEGPANNARFLFSPYSKYAEFAIQFEQPGTFIDANIHARAWKKAKAMLHSYKTSQQWTTAS